jgi:hypothetical protein
MNTSDFERQAAHLCARLDRKIQDRAAQQQQLSDQKTAAKKAVEEARMAEQLAAAQMIIARYTNHLLDQSTDESVYSVVMTLSQTEVSVELKDFLDRCWNVYSLTDEAVVAKIVCEFLSKAKLNWVIVPDTSNICGYFPTDCYVIRAWRSPHR